MSTTILVAGRDVHFVDNYATFSVVSHGLIRTHLWPNRFYNMCVVSVYLYSLFVFCLFGRLVKKTAYIKLLWYTTHKSNSENKITIDIHIDGDVDEHEGR